MAQGTQPKTERNKKLYQDYIDKMSIPLLCAKYDLTTKRVYEIINMCGGPNRRMVKKRKKSKVEPAVAQSDLTSNDIESLQDASASTTEGGE